MSTYTRRPKPANPVPPTIVLEEVKNHFGVNIMKLSRKRKIVVARQVAVLLLREESGQKVAAVGQHFPSEYLKPKWKKVQEPRRKTRDHTFAINAMASLRTFLSTPEGKELKQEIEILRTRIKTKMAA